MNTPLQRRTGAARLAEKIAIVALGCAAVLIIGGGLFAIGLVATPAVELIEALVRIPETNEAWLARVSFNALLSGTLVTSLVALLIGTPLGLAAAVYLQEERLSTTRRLARRALAVCAGLPCVVLAGATLWALGPSPLLGVSAPPSGLVAGVVLGVFVAATVATLSANALESLAPDLRRSAIALGARRFQVVWRVSFPAARWGLVAATGVGATRVAGEAAVLALLSGGHAAATPNPLAPLETLGGFAVRSLPSELIAHGAAYNSVFAAAVLLMVWSWAILALGGRAVRVARKGGAES